MTFLTFFYLFLLFLGLVISQEIFYRFPRFSLYFFAIGSVILFPCWVLLIGVDDWFAWMKVLTIALGILLLSVLRNTRLGQTVFVRWATYAFLVVNIMEAVVKDFTTGTIANYLNVVAGILLVLTLNRIDTIRIRTTRQKDLRWTAMTMAWIVGYTLWNWVFVYLNFGFQSAMAHVAVLGSALMMAFVDKERWLQARLFTLGTFFMIFHSFPHLGARLSGGDVYPGFGMVVAFIAAGFMLVYATIVLKREFRQRKAWQENA